MCLWPYLSLERCRFGAPPIPANKNLGGDGSFNNWNSKKIRERGMNLKRNIQRRFYRAWWLTENRKMRKRKKSRLSPMLMPGGSLESKVFKTERTQEREKGKWHVFQVALRWQCGHVKEAMVLELTREASHKVTDEQLVSTSELMVVETMWKERGFLA